MAGIETKLHKLKEQVLNLNIGFPADGALTPDKIYRYLNMDVFSKFLWAIGNVPTYVLDDKLVETLDIKTIAHSVYAMCEAGVMRLPYKKLLVEYTTPDLDIGRIFALCEEVEYDGYDIRVTMITMDTTGEFKGVVRPRPYTVYTRVSEHDSQYLSQAVKIAPYISDLSKEVFMDKTANAEIVDIESRIGLRSLCILMCALSTKGVSRDFVTESDLGKINKKRAAKKGGTTINPHSVLRIGHVYDQSGKSQSHSGKGRSVRVHMRRGHTRNQRHGPGNSQSKIIYIEPMLINYNPGDDTPVPQVLVKM